MSGTVLYAHPALGDGQSFNFHSCVIPLSVPALINRLNVPVRGYHSHELPDSAIAAARIIIIDVHWYMKLPSVLRFVERVHRVSPKALVVAGGLTATVFAKQLVERGCDYVIRGDGEVPLTRLVDALLNGSAADVERVPNLVGAGGLNTPWTYHLTKSDLDSNDYIDISFHAPLEKRLRAVHKAFQPTESRFDVYPYLIPFRGCPIICEGCCGSAHRQSEYFARGVIVRSPDRLAADLDRLESTDWVQFVRCYHDFLTLLPERYAQTALRRKSRLYLYYEFTSLPTADQLEFLLGRFPGGLLVFSLGEKHTTSPDLVDISQLLERVRQVKRAPGYEPLIWYSSVFAQDPSSAYARAVDSLKQTAGCIVRDVAPCWLEVPEIRHADDPGSFERFLGEAKDLSSATHL